LGRSYSQSGIAHAPKLYSAGFGPKLMNKLRLTYELAAQHAEREPVVGREPLYRPARRVPNAISLHKSQDRRYL
jgi:hypothetical protein